MAELERIYVIPLKKVGFKSSKAAPTAIKRIKSFLTRNMKVEEEKIWIDESLNNEVWSHGKFKMPSRIRVKAVKFDDGVVEAYSPELAFKKSRRQLLKEEKEKKEPILKKEEEGAEAAEGAAPAEKDYDITPTAEGDVKIKKKKAPKEKKEETVKEEKPAEPKKEEAPEKKKAPTKKKESKPKTAKKAPSKPKAQKKKSGSKETKKSE